MDRNELLKAVAAMLPGGKGILAADESGRTIAARFAAHGIPCTDETRRAYRELLFTTPGLGEFIGGAILFDETFRQAGPGGSPFPELLARVGIVPGIKVDAGTVALADRHGERITEGIDGLRERLSEYRDLGARFTKWRAVFGVSDEMPSHGAVVANACSLAIYAALSQEAGLVPIVEPEILMAGDHGIERCEEITRAVLGAVFEALFDQDVLVEGLLLKVGIVVSGTECERQAGIPEIAEATLRCLRRSVPAAVPAVVFLSGGLGEEAATERLAAIHGAGSAPWQLSFSFGRALQSSALECWRGIPANVPAAQAALLHRARANALAIGGGTPGV